MSEENVEIIRRGFEILAEGVPQGDFGAVFDELVREGIAAPDVVWKLSDPGYGSVAAGDDIVGRAGFVEFWRIWTADDDLVFEAEEFIDAGNDRVVVVALHHAIGKRSRAPVEMRYGFISTFEGRRVVHQEFFADPRQTLEAAGLSE